MSNDPVVTNGVAAPEPTALAAEPPPADEPAPAVAASPEPAAEPTEPAAPPEPTFDEMGLHPDIRTALDDMGYFRPTPVQATVFTPVAEGKDLLVQSRTGTGKTAAFGLPVLNRLVPAQATPQALILAPTRELALQVSRELSSIGKHRGIIVETLYGGAPIGKQISALRKGVHIVVGTPGRVLDHIGRRTLDTKTISTFILDECDEMLSMGFLEDIERVVSHLPEKRQTLLFSATMPEEVHRYSRRHMKAPEQIKLSSGNISVEEIHHAYYVVSGIGRARDLLKLLFSEEPESAIIFCNTRDETNAVAKFLQRQGLDAEALSSDLSQNDRERVMGRMKAHNLRYLVATDVAARGIDISNLSHVINYSFPDSAEVYVHRTGRTGRAGKRGVALSLIGPRDLGAFWLLKLTYKLKPEERDLPSETIFEGKLKHPLPPLGAPKPPDPVSILVRGVPEAVTDLERGIFEKLLTHPQGRRVLARLAAERLSELTTKTRPKTERPARAEGDNGEPEGFRSRREGEGFRDRSREDRPARDGGEGFRSRRDGEGFRSREDRPARDGEGFRPRRDGEGFRSREDRPARDGEGFRSREDRPARDGEGFRSREDRPARDGEGFRSRRDGEGFRDRSREDRPAREGEGGDRPARDGGEGFRSRRDGEGFRDRGDRDRGRRDDRPRDEAEAAAPTTEATERPAREGGEGFRSRRDGEGFRDRGDRDRGRRDDRPRDEAEAATPAAEGAERPAADLRDRGERDRGDRDRGDRDRGRFRDRGDRDRGRFRDREDRPARDAGEEAREPVTPSEAPADTTAAEAPATVETTPVAAPREERHRDRRDRDGRREGRREGRETSEREQAPAPRTEVSEPAMATVPGDSQGLPARPAAAKPEARAEAKPSKADAKPEGKRSNQEFWETWADQKAARPTPVAAEAPAAEPASSEEPRDTRRKGHGKAEAKHGKAEAKHSKADAKTDAKADKADKADAKPARSKAEPAKKASEKPDDGEQVRLYVSLGKKHGITADSLRELLGGDERAKIGSVMLRDTHANVRVPSGLAERIIAQHHGTTYDGNAVTVELSR